MIFNHDLSPIIFSLGDLHFRWYGLLFAFGILLNYLFVSWIFKRKKYDMKHLDSLLVYLFVGMVVGARLGHAVFYNFDFYANNPVEIFKIWKGGLASHGGAIGVFLAYWLWTKVNKVKFNKYIDAFALGIPLTAIFVRIGNFFNSEIVGVPTNGNWGIIYERLGEDFPRHPVQLYESFGSLTIFVLMFWIYKKYDKKMPKLSYMFLLLTLYFAMRFVAEFWKKRHILPVDFPISMGQVLSIVPLLIGLSYFLFFFAKARKKNHA